MQMIDVHVNIHHSVPDGLGDNMTKSRYVDGAFICEKNISNNR